MREESEEHSESHGMVKGGGIPYQTFNLGSAGSTPVHATNIGERNRGLSSEIEKTRWYLEVARIDYCPGRGGHVHSYINMINWGHKHPYCACCGFEDESRLVG